MGKIQCNSTHYKNNSYNDQLVNKKKHNWYEMKLNDEYQRLKTLLDKKRRNSYEYIFGQTDYKKQLNRMNKWCSIAFKPLPENFYNQHKIEIEVSFYFYLFTET